MEPIEHQNGFNLPSKGSYQLKKLNDAHRAIMRMSLSGMMSDKEIAEALDVTPVMVGITKRSAIFIKQMELMRAVLDADAIEAAGLISELQPVAALKLGELLVDPNLDKKLLARVAQDLLDRGGNSATKRLEIASVYATADDLAKVRERAKERARASGQMVEDTAYTEVDS